MKAHKITMLGTGLIGMFYTMTLHGQRRRDRVHRVYSRTEERARAFSAEWNIPNWSTDLSEAIQDPECDTVVIGLPNHLHLECVRLAAEAGKNILCTKPLGRTAKEAKEMLDIVEQTGVFHGYLEDLVYTPKTLKAIASVRAGSLGDILWVRSRETHPGPHSSWFWDIEQAGGGAIVDMGCHCIEITRNFIGKDIRPVEVMCWADTLVHSIEAEDQALAWIRYENGAVGQFEVSWAFRGGMDLRDEVAGTEGTIMLNHWLRTGFDMFTTGESGSYVAEKAESDKGWLFPVGDEPNALGYVHMFSDMFDAMDAGAPSAHEDFYDGYVVNAIIDACYASAKSKQWEPVQLEWRGATDVKKVGTAKKMHEGKEIIKDELMPDGRTKRILKDLESGDISEIIL